jgi:hypothetical protein
MHRKNLLILTLFVFSSSLVAGEFRQYKNKMFNNLKELTKLDGAIKVYYHKEKKKDKLKKVLKKLRKENKGYFEAKHQDFIDSESVVRFIFEKIGWEPEFCSDLKNIDDENMRQCQSALSKFLDPINNLKLNKRHMLYLNGDNNGSDFKSVFIIGHDSKERDFVITELSIWDER